jgi:hypothetical protein
MAISSLRGDSPDGRVGDERLAAPVAVLTRRADEVASWYGALADGFVGSGGELPSIDASDDSFLDVVLPAVDSCGEPERASRAEKLLWSGQYLGDVNKQRSDLLEPAAQVRAARARPWWRR